MTFFEGWTGIGRVLVSGLCAYAVLVLTLRIAGKRTLAKMNAFDLVVTVALGSTLASVITSSRLPLAEGLLALVLLIGLQVAVAFAASRSTRLDKVVKSEPRLLVRRGQLLSGAMKEERLTEGEILAAIRQHGLDSLDRADAVILESNGAFSVIESVGGPDARAVPPRP